jgi:coenzyme F420 hydrogenase subunit beta
VIAEPKACQELENNVIKKGLCTLCGACIGLCPYIVAHRGRVVVRDACNLSEGQCSTFCPRVSLDLDELSRVVLGKPYTWDGMHGILSICMARSTDSTLKARAQDAGTVTVLTRHALEEGFIDSAVMTRFEDKAFPQTRVVSDGEALLGYTRSNYMAVPVVEAFNRAIAEPERKRIAVIGTPCQTLALAKMKGSRSAEQNGIDRLEMVIGLFCTWALSYPDFAEFLEGEISDPIVKYKIPPPPANVMQFFTRSAQIDVPLDRIMPFVRPACRLCHDLTSEFADISVGAVEFADMAVGGSQGAQGAWNTVIVRTEKGMRLLDSARRKGIIETDELPEKTLDHLKYAARNKKKRALQNIVRKTGSEQDLLYLKAGASTAAALLDE